jgi:trk system potassium uptake protein TrkA
MHCARRLVKMGCEVLALDNDEERVHQIQDDVQRVKIGDARDRETLEAVLTDAVDEVVVSLGESIEASILSTLHLHQIGVKSIRTKAINEDHATILKAVGATEVFFPEQETAERMARRIAHPHLLDFFPFAEDYRIMEIVAPSHFAGKTLVESGLRSEYNLLALAIKNGVTEQFNFMPGADAVIRAGDILIVLGQEFNLARLSAMD